MSTNWAFDHIENKHNLYRGEDIYEKVLEISKRTLEIYSCL